MHESLVAANTAEVCARLGPCALVNVGRQHHESAAAVLLRTLGEANTLAWVIADIEAMMFGEVRRNRTGQRPVGGRSRPLTFLNSPEGDATWI